jgi:glucosamine-phosphate N-acetyltransferase
MVMLDVRVRELIPTDLENGFLESLDSLSEVGLTPAQARAVLSDRPPGSFTYVAVCDRRVVGTATLLFERKFIHAGGRVGHIEDVAVDRKYQGRGIGTTLVRHAVEQAKRLGCYKVILDCTEDLVPFYGRMGFKPFNCGLRLNLAEPAA